MKQIVLKLFCCHEWTTHAKNEYSWEERRLIPGTEHWINPQWEENTVESTTEIIICKKCGDIKTIEY